MRQNHETNHRNLWNAGPEVTELQNQLWPLRLDFLLCENINPCLFQPLSVPLFSAALCISDRHTTTL